MQGTTTQKSFSWSLNASRTLPNHRLSPGAPPRNQNTPLLSNIFSLCRAGKIFYGRFLTLANILRICDLCCLQKNLEMRFLFPGIKPSFNWETKGDNFKVPSGTHSNFAPPIKHVCFDLTNFLITSGTNIIAKVKLSYKTRSKHHHQGPKRLVNWQMFLRNIHVCFSP